jgi:hypothetical protein
VIEYNDGRRGKADVLVAACKIRRTCAQEGSAQTLCRSNKRGNKKAPDDAGAFE